MSNRLDFFTFEVTSEGKDRQTVLFSLNILLSTQFYREEKKISEPLIQVLGSLLSLRKKIGKTSEILLL